MSNDDLLNALGGLAREQRDAEETPDPFSADEQDALVGSVLGLMATEAAAEHPNVVAFRAPDAPKKTSSRWLMAAGAGLAIAAGLVFMLRPTAVAPAGAGLPTYSLHSTTGDKPMRGPDAPPVERAVYSPGSRLELVVRPAESITSKPSASAWLTGAAAPSPWPHAFELGTSGGMRTVGPLAADLTTGDYTLEVIVCPEGTQPALPAPKNCQSLGYPLTISE